LIEPGFDTARLLLRLRQEGITHSGVLRAVEKVDRADFVDDPAHKVLAAQDTLLPIPCGQVIPRPSTAGRLLQALELPEIAGARLLLIGIEAGYMAALAADMGAVVFALDRYRTLAEGARQRFARLGRWSIAVHQGDPAAGLPEVAPFDRILVQAALTEIPPALRQQLASGGIVVAAETGKDAQCVIRIKSDGAVYRSPLGDVLAPFLQGQAQAL
jgi:protein-L-isoaspartate(D-aspartate) O-methyltransferase